MCNKLISKFKLKTVQIFSPNSFIHLTNLPWSFQYPLNFQKFDGNDFSHY